MDRYVMDGYPERPYGDAEEAPGALSAECRAKVSRLKVAVVGGGFAGLLAARTLARSGAAVTVYEARSQVGGRVLSDTRFARGRITEFGAELVGSIHTRWCALAKEYGLALISRMDGDLYRGQQLQQRLILDTLLTPDEVKDVEKKRRDNVLRPLAQFAARWIDRGMESHPWDQPYDPKSTRPSLAQIDAMSVADGLRQTLGLTPGERLWLATEHLLVNNNVSPLENTSFLALLCLVRGGQTELSTIRDPLMGYWDELEIYRCADGCQRLALAVAAEVVAMKGCHVRTNLGVRRIDLRPARGGGVLVTARSTRNSRFDEWLREKVPGNPLMDTARYDYVLLTAPPSVWEYIEIVPTHPKDVVGLMGYGPAVKFFSNVRDRFWIKDGFAPMGGTMDIGQVWEGTDNQTRVGGQDVVLSVFTGARRPTEKDYIGDLKRLYPATTRRPGSGYRANLRDTKRVDWAGEAYIETGYSSPRPTQVLRVGRALSRPFLDRLLFAGEHAQPDHFGYMEGAIRSGERAARMLLDTVCPPPEPPEPPRVAVRGAGVRDRSVVPAG